MYTQVTTPLTVDQELPGPFAGKMFAEDLTQFTHFYVRSFGFLELAGILCTTQLSA